MINLIQNAARKIIDIVIQPSKWSLDNANGVENSTVIPRVAFESTILKHNIRSIDPVHMRVSAAFQYQINFRLDGKLKYDELPTKDLTDLMSYLTFVFSTHPGLLEKSVEEIDGMDAWEFSHVDPCLFESDSARYQITSVLVNSFIPVIEQSNNDWLMVLVFSFDVQMECKKSAYRKYFEDETNINHPGLNGGLIGNINSLEINTNRKNPPIKLAGSRVIELNP